MKVRLFPPLITAFAFFNYLGDLLASVYEHHIEAFAFKKYEWSEYIIHAFDFAFALETTRAKRVP